jgi:hypothetical protein
MCLNETYSTVCKGKNLSDKFPIQNGLKKRRRFITISLHLCFEICHWEGPREILRVEIEQGISFRPMLIK